jgi:hypothetical protein
MLFLKETVRLYQSEANAHHGRGAMARFGWEVLSIEKVSVPGDKRKRAVWELKARKGWAPVIALLDAWEAAKAIFKAKST